MYRTIHCIACGRKAGEHNVSLFRFPRNATRCKQWIERAGLVQLQGLSATAIYEKYRLCSSHFDSTQFRVSQFAGDRQLKLIRNALPSRFNGSSNARCQYWSTNAVTAEPSSHVSISNDAAFGLSEWPESAEDLQILASQLCRLCANESEDLIEVFGEDGQKMDLCNKIHTHLPIMVTEHDALPTSCCCYCISKLEMCHKFVVSCLDANSKLCTILHLPKCSDSEDVDSLLIPEEHNGVNEIASRDTHNSSSAEMDGNVCVQPTSGECKLLKSETEVEKEVKINNVMKVEGEDLNISDRESPMSLRSTFLQQEEEDMQQAILITSVRSSAQTAKKELKKKRKRFQEKKFRRSNFQVLLLKRSRSTSSRSMPSAKYRLQQNWLNKRQYNTKSIMCNLCNLQFMNVNRLRSHRAIVHSHLHYKCYACGKLFKQQSNLRRHMGIHKKLYTCKICFETLPTYQLMLLHRRSHIRTKEFSKVTDSQYLNSVSCTAENESISPTIAPEYVAVKMDPSICIEPRENDETLDNGEGSQSPNENKTEATMYSLSDDLAVTTEAKVTFVDSSEMSHTSDTTGQKFHTIQEVEAPLLNIMATSIDRRHIFQEPEIVEAVNSIKEEGLQYDQQICQVEYEQAYVDSSAVHEIVTFVDSEASNTSTELYHCSSCNKIFTTELAYRNHLSKHSLEKKFVCPTCKRPFAHQWALDSHLRIHSDEKPFACSFCGEKFLFKRSLVVHERIHTENKTFKCNVCEKCFNSVTRLRQHIITHSDDWPFRCTFCSKEFRRREALKNHVAKHTDECKLCNHKPDVKVKKDDDRTLKRASDIKQEPLSENCVIFGEFGSSDVVIESHADATPEINDGNVACEYVI